MADNEITAWVTLPDGVEPEAVAAYIQRRLIGAIARERDAVTEEVLRGTSGGIEPRGIMAADA